VLGGSIDATRRKDAILIDAAKLSGSLENTGAEKKCRRNRTRSGAGVVATAAEMFPPRISITLVSYQFSAALSQFCESFRHHATHRV